MRVREERVRRLGRWDKPDDGHGNSGCWRLVRDHPVPAAGVVGVNLGVGGNFLLVHEDAHPDDHGIVKDRWVGAGVVGEVKLDIGAGWRLYSRC